MATAEVTVRGAGIFGLAVAWACLKRGARVRVVESRRVGAGASGGIVGALAPHVPGAWNDKKAFQLESLLMAEAWWAGVAAAGGRDPGYARLGRLQPLADAGAVALAGERGRAAAKLWGGAAEWRIVGAEAAPEWAPPSPTGRYVLDTLSARIHPRLAVAALAAAIRARGGEIVEGAGAGEPPDAGLVVHATGWEGLGELSAALGRPAGGGVKGQAALLRLDAATRPQIFAGGLHIVPHGDGTVAVGSTSERDFALPGATDAALDALVERARTLCPALAGAKVLERWAGVRPRARSRAPIVGPWPGRPGHFIANGGFKIGFGMAPKAGEALADLLLDGRDTIPEGFRAEANI